MCSYRSQAAAKWIIHLGKLFCYNLNSCSTAVVVTLILCQARSLFSAPYQFFMCSHLSSGDGCHPNGGCCVFTCPPGSDISWTLTDGEGQMWLYLLFKNLAYFCLTFSCFWATGVPKKIISPMRRDCVTITSSHLFIQWLCFTRGNNWPGWATGGASVVPDYQAAWWGWALTPT